jgi:DNA-binding NarL/FixJ family response regulator
MASALFISEATIESHLSHIYEKLAIHNRRELFACLFDEIYKPKIHVFGEQDSSFLNTR